MDKITRHHLQNLANSSFVRQKDGKVNTVLTTTIEANGKTYLVPTVFDGKILKANTRDSIQKLLRKAISTGVFEVFKTRAEADAFDKQIHTDNDHLPDGKMLYLSPNEAHKILNQRSQSQQTENTSIMNSGELK